MSAVKVLATVWWDVDMVFVVNSMQRGATAIVLPYQVALRRQETLKWEVCPGSPQCGRAGHGCVHVYPTVHTALTWPRRTSTCLAI